MRIIAGEYKGRKLKFVKHTQLRPTMDRVKESLFNVLGGNLSDAKALDIFTGCGSLGLEALSRGVEEVTFVDSSKEATQILRENLTTLAVPKNRFRVYLLDWRSALERLKQLKISYDLVLMDPPYERDSEIQNVLMALSDFGIVRPSSRVVAEHSSRLELTEPMLQSRFRGIKTLRFGGTHLSFFETI